MTELITALIISYCGMAANKNKCVKKVTACVLKSGVLHVELMPELEKKENEITTIACYHKYQGLK